MSEVLGICTRESFSLKAAGSRVPVLLCKDFSAIILIRCLGGKLLHRLIKFRNNNYLIKVYCTIKYLSYYIHFSF